MQDRRCVRPPRQVAGCSELSAVMGPTVAIHLGLFPLAGSIPPRPIWADRFARTEDSLGRCSQSPVLPPCAKGPSAKPRIRCVQAVLVRVTVQGVITDCSVACGLSVHLSSLVLSRKCCTSRHCWCCTRDQPGRVVQYSDQQAEVGLAARALDQEAHFPGKEGIHNGSRATPATVAHSMTSARQDGGGLPMCPSHGKPQTQLSAGNMHACAAVPHMHIERNDDRLVIDPNLGNAEFSLEEASSTSNSPLAAARGYLCPEHRLRRPTRSASALKGRRKWRAGRPGNRNTNLQGGSAAVCGIAACAGA